MTNFLPGCYYTLFVMLGSMIMCGLINQIVYTQDGYHVQYYCHQYNWIIHYLVNLLLK